MKRSIFLRSLFVLIFLCFFSLSLTTFAKVHISKKQLTMTVSEKYTLKISGTKSKIIWKSSKPKIAKVNNKGKIKALKKGNTIISAKIGKKVYKCKVIVRKAKGNNPHSNNVPDNSISGINKYDINDNQKQTASSSNETSFPTMNPKSDSDNISVEEIIEGKSAYWKYSVSDIGENFIEVENSNGTDKYRFVLDSIPKDIFYKGTVEKYEPLNNIIELSGEKMDFSEISKGRIVDIVYKYQKRKTICTKECVAINVYEEGYNNFSIKNVYWNCYVAAISNKQIMINNADGELVGNFQFDSPNFTCFLNATLIEHPNRVVDISNGKSISFNSIRGGDLVDVLTDSSSGSDGDLDLWQGYSPNIERIYAINVHRE